MLWWIVFLSASLPVPVRITALLLSASRFGNVLWWCRWK